MKAAKASYTERVSELQYQSLKVWIYLGDFDCLFRLQILRIHFRLKVQPEKFSRQFGCEVQNDNWRYLLELADKIFD